MGRISPCLHSISNRWQGCLEPVRLLQYRILNFDAILKNDTLVLIPQQKEKKKVLGTQNEIIYFLYFFINLHTVLLQEKSLKTIQHIVIILISMPVWLKTGRSVVFNSFSTFDTVKCAYCIILNMWF